MARRYSLLYNQTIITNDQFKALPTTPIQLMGAPGAGFVIIPDRIVLVGNFGAGAYTGEDAESYIVARYTTGPLDVSNYLANSAAATPPFTFLTTFLNANPAIVQLREWQSSSDPADGWGNIPVPDIYQPNSAIELYCDNNGAGNFGGGNAANALWVELFYTVAQIPT